MNTPNNTQDTDGGILSSDLFGGFGREWNPKDVVMTPPQIARRIVQHFKPTGRILDPCKGNGAFADEMPGCEWCEIREGKDFMEWQEPVDWIVSNPPYSNFYEWLLHSFALAENVVYLIPTQKVFTPLRCLSAALEYGGIKEILIIGTGTQCGFPLGFAVGAVHFKRGYKGETRIGYPPNSVLPKK